MRLPTVTQKQIYLEDARAFNEAIWAAHLAGEPYLVPGEPEEFKSRRAAEIQGNLHSFWRARGYRLSVRLREDRRIAITVVPASVKPRRPSKPMTDEDYITCQPASWVA